VCSISPDIRFTAIGAPRQIWAVSAIHGEVHRLIQLHDALMEQIRPGDRIVYLGNYTGYGSYSRETVDEILAFRRQILSIPGMKPDDLIYLRGGQEEMWQKLTQLQFCPNPVDTLLWMMGNGMNNTLQNYGICPHEGIIAAREGVMALTRWTNKVRETLRANPGHEIFMMQFRRAAYTSMDSRFPILFVNAGIDPARPLEQQEDNFWWSGNNFTDIHDPYQPFEKVIRGFDPTHQGITLNCVTASLDGGCGFGGSLVCAHMAADGEIYELLEA